MIKNLSLELGPTTMKDKIVVETSDHAKLFIQLSYKWYLDHGGKIALDLSNRRQRP